MGLRVCNSKYQRDFCTGRTWGHASLLLLESSGTGERRKWRKKTERVDKKDLNSPVVMSRGRSVGKKGGKRLNYC